MLLLFLLIIFDIRCGNSAEILKSKYRIVGGKNATIAEYPYQASILMKDSQICGGSIISQKFILTAAHCTIEFSTDQLKVRVGSSFRNNGGTIFYVAKIHTHPQFNYDTFDYDLSILQLKAALIFGSAVHQITLASIGTIISDGLSATATGWGKVAQNRKPSNQLLEVSLPIISTKSCRKYYKNLTERMFCAGYDEGGKDTCQGDSGGPLVVSGILIGVTSWGQVCGQAKNPGVYTSVPIVRKYIDSIIN